MSLAKSLAAHFRGGEVLSLEGDLGAGKTVFVKGLAQGLGIEGEILSPTFTILRQYQGRLPLNHFDAYRIEEPDEMEQIGFEEYLADGSVVVVEWASHIQELLPDDAIHITITGEGDAPRHIRLEGNLKEAEID